MQYFIMYDKERKLYYVLHSDTFQFMTEGFKYWSQANAAMRKLDA